MERAKSQGKGVILTLISALLLGTSFIFAQILLQHMSPEMMEFYWFVFGAAISIIIAMIAKRASPSKYLRNHWKEGLVLGVFNGSAAILWAVSINLIGASLSAFFFRLTTIFLIVMGIVFLKEKLTIWEFAGGIVAIAGAFLLSYKTPEELHYGIIVAIITAFIAAISEFLGKVYVRRIEPYTLSAIRTTFSLLIIGVISSATAKIALIPAWTLPWIFVGSLLSSVLGFLVYYKALQEIEIAQAAIIRTLDPFIVLIYALIIFGTLPTLPEIMGGSLIITGVIISQVGMLKSNNLFKSS